MIPDPPIPQAPPRARYSIKVYGGVHDGRVLEMNERPEWVRLPDPLPEITAYGAYHMLDAIRVSDYRLLRVCIPFRDGRAERWVYVPSNFPQYDNASIQRIAKALWPQMFAQENA